MSTATLVFERETTHLPSAVLAASVHVLLFVVLIFGISWQTRAPDAVSVELWDLPPVAPRVEIPPEIKPESAPPPPPVARAEPKPAPAPPKADIALEKEKKAAPKKAEARKDEPKKDEPKLSIDFSRQMNDQLARELEGVQKERERREVLAQFSKPAAASGPTIDPTYANRIRLRIKPLIAIPPDIIGNPEAIYDVEQLPTGEVLSVKLKKSSGHRAYDDAVERAILRASPLPRPERADQLQRRLELTFRPKD